MRLRGMLPKHLTHGFREWCSAAVPIASRRIIQYAIPSSSDRPGPDHRQFRLEKFFVTFAAMVLTFFIAGLLLSLVLQARR